MFIKIDKDVTYEVGILRKTLSSCKYQLKMKIKIRKHQAQ